MGAADFVAGGIGAGISTAVSRNFYIFGPAIVKVTTGGGNQSELGLTDSPISIQPRFVHQDLYCDDFQQVPYDVLTQLADCTIEMTLVHYNNDTLLSCLAESTGGGSDGTLAGSGILLGGGKAIGEGGKGGNHYVTLEITPGKKSNKSWIFPATYLSEQPMILPLGTKRSLCKLRWRAIPYGGAPISQGKEVSDFSSTNTVLWMHE